MTTSQPYDPSNPFKVGNNLCWLHGEHYRVAEVLEVEEDRVKLSGLTSDYWRSKNRCSLAWIKPHQHKLRLLGNPR